MRLLVLMLSVIWFAMPLSWASAADTVTLPNCLLSLDEEVQVPAQEAGVLVKIPVREGQQVTAGELLAQIDDIVPMAQYNIAKFKLKVAEKQASDDIQVRFAIAGAAVYAAKLERSLRANATTPGTVSDSVVDEQRLERDKFRLQIEKARKDVEVNALQMQVSKAELKAAEANLKHRRMLAPLDAVVIELTRHKGEWVAAGDPVMRLLRLDRLRVQGFLNVKKYQPSEIKDRPVRVVVTLAGGRREAFPGRIVFVKPMVQAGGEFLVRAEVQNRKQGDFWVLRPGLSAEMTIQLK